MKLAVVIPAAGASTRFGPDRDKLDEEIAGRPVLQRTVELFVKREDVDAVIVAGPHSEEAMSQFKRRHGDKLALLGVAICRGGADFRHETVKAALEHVGADCTHIAVHDAARPCTAPELIDRIFEAARRHDAVVPAVEIGDTLKRVSEASQVEEDLDPLDAILGGAGKSAVTTRTVEETISRERLVAAQTPQVFAADLLRRAYAQSDLSSTDDAGLVERLGEPIVVVEGDVRNIKITRPGDLRLAMLILNLNPPKERAVHKRF